MVPHLRNVAAPLFLSILFTFSTSALAEQSNLVQSPLSRFRRALPSERVPGQYIILLRESTLPPESVSVVTNELLARYGGRTRILLQNTVKGFSANMTEEQAIRLSEDPRVLLVEENSKAYLSTQQIVSAPDLWALDRVDQRIPVGTGAEDDRYYYCEQASGVIAYVLDTGINRDHQEFQQYFGGSRVLNGVKFANDNWIRPGEAADYGTWPCGGWYDVYSAGHGTAVASIIGGNVTGIAKQVRLVPLRVFECHRPTPSNPSGGITLASVEHLCWALDWIKSTSNPNRNQRPALVNISLHVRVPLPPDPTGYYEAALESVINGLVLDSPGWTGIPVITSANNQDTYLACTSPARMAWSNTSFLTPGHVISVGGIQESDTRWISTGTERYLGETDCSNNSVAAPASNYGPIVDIWAPAHNLREAHIASASSYRTTVNLRSGTSFAAAVVSGVVARMLQANMSLTPQQVWNQLQTDATVITPISGNGKLVYRNGPTCSPELP